MIEPGRFSPATQHELSVTLDVAWQAIIEARRNIRALEKGRTRAERRNRQLDKKLKEARERTKEALVRGKSFEQAFAVLKEQVKSAAFQSTSLRRALDDEEAGTQELKKRLAALTDTLYDCRKLREEQDGALTEQDTVPVSMRRDLARAEAFQNAVEADLAIAAEKAISLEKQLSELEEQHRVLEEQAESLASQNTCLEQVLEAEKASAEGLRTQLAAAVDMAGACEKQFSNSDEQRRGLEEQVNASVARTAEMEQVLTAEKSEAEDLRMQLAAAADTVEKFETRLRESEEQCRILEEQEKCAGSRSAELQRALDAEKAGAEELRKQLAAAADTVHAFEKQLRESEEHRRALEENVKNVASQNAELQQTLDAEQVGAERLRKQLAATGDTIRTLQKEFGDSEKQRSALEAQLAKAGEAQAAFEAELSDARAVVARLGEENERLRRELAEAREEIVNRNAQLATEEQLGATLRTNVNVLHRTMEQLGRRLNDPLTDSVLTPAHKNRRVIWIGCRDCPGCSLFTAFSMDKLVASDPQQALEILSGQGADGLITDIAVTGIDWLGDARKRWPDLIMIVTIGPTDSPLPIDSPLCSIATLVLSQPCEHEDVAVAVRCAFLREALSSGSEVLDAERTPTCPRLLIAEDDESTRTLLSTGLNERGYDTACVENGAAALEAIEAHDFDLLVADIEMPRMDGIELTAKAKHLKPRLPIIILSAAGNVDAALKAMRAGAYCYVPKPASAEQLSLAVERAMLADRLERELRDQNALLDKRTNELERALHELHEAANLIATCRRPQTERGGVSA